jgi:iron complex outermembrane receptor protein
MFAMYSRARFGFASALAATLGIVAFAMGGDARAQSVSESSPDAGASSLEEVTISARRKTERLQDVPISVSAFSADQLESLGITDQVTLADFTPGFSFTDFTNGRSDRGAYRSLIFRGITSTSNTAVTADALAFLDGAPVTFNDILINDSIERIEVLKGPQNVYFGRSTFTGALNYVTKNPGETFKASSTMEVGNYNEYKLDAHIEGPIVANALTFGFDAQVYNKDGDYTDFASPGVSFGGRQTKAFALTLYATPTDGLSFKLYETFFNYNDGISAAIVIPSAATSNCNPGAPAGSGNTGNFFPCGTIPKLQNSWVAQSLNYSSIENQELNNPGLGYDPNYRNCDHLGLCANTEGVHLITNYALPWYGIKFQNITAYHIKVDADLQNAVDQAAFPNPEFGNAAYPYAPAYTPTFDYNIIDKIWDYDTEFRLSSAEDQPLRWTIGSNVVRTKDITQLWFVESFPPLNGAVSPNPDKVPGEVGAHTLGIFGGLYYDPIKEVTLSAEIRNQADKRQDQSAVTGQYLEEEFRSWSPRVSAEYKPTSDLNIYASYSAGVRPGGFNSGLVGLPQRLLTQIAALVGTAPVAIQEEKLWTDEIGVKGTFLDHTLNANVSVYVGKLTNQQTDQTAILAVPDPNFGGRFDIYKNTGDVDIHGIEGDWRWRASRMLTLSGSFAWNYTGEHETGCYACYLVTGSYNLDGTRLSDSPEYMATLGADLTDHLTPMVDWFAHLEYAYKGSIFIEQNGLNLTQTGSANKVNGQVGIDNKTYTLSLWVTNLLNDLTYTDGELSDDFLSGNPYGVRAGLADKRAFGVRFKYNFL